MPGEKPNPLFEEWLGEWLEQAENHGNQNKCQTYRKALRGMERYPIPLSSGDEAQRIVGIGKVIAKRLDDKLKKHLENDPELREKLILEGATKRTFDNANANSNDSQESGAPKKKRKPRKPATYIPQYRSGGYGILVGLLKADLGDDNLSKAEVIKHAQDHCNISYNKPEDPTSKYTGWSSMKSLVDKDLVKKIGRTKYSLTVEGEALAQKLVNIELGIENTATEEETAVVATPSSKENVEKKTKTSKTGKAKDSAPTVAPKAVVNSGNNVTPVMTKKGGKELSRRAKSLQEMSVKKTIVLGGKSGPILKRSGTFSGFGLTNQLSSASLLSPAAPSPSSLNYCGSLSSASSGGKDLVSLGKSSSNTTSVSSQLAAKWNGYLYLDDVLNPVQTKDEAGVEIRGQKIGFRVRFPTKKTMEGLFNCQVYKDKFSVGYIEEDYAPDRLPPKLPNLNVRPPQTVSTFSDSDFQDTPPGAAKNDVVHISSTPCTPAVAPISAAARKLARVGKSKGQLILGETTQSKTIILTERPKEAPPPSEVVPIETFERVVVAQPGQYDVIVIVDNREVKNQSERGYILQELQKKRVKAEIRALPLGDFTWLARHLVTGAEYLLGYIGERKRMDDLCGSIVDGRYREQQYRLSDCGLPHVIYLVEDYGKITHQKMKASAIYTAMTGANENFDFFVKRTSETKGTVEYLKDLTEHIISSLKNVTLVKKYFDTPAEDIDYTQDPAKLSLLQDEKGDLPVMSYSQFGTRTVKTKKKTQSEIFGRQLMVIKYMTPDKVIAIVTKYPTLASLMKAYDDCGHDCAMKKALLQNLSCGKTSVGTKLSETVYKLYNEDY